MTAAPELLPLPELPRQVEGYNSDYWEAGQIEEYAADYARACVEANLAPLQAEIEALRAEVEKVTCELMDAITRADKLAEALRRYRNEVPIGHQPHMLAHEVDDLLREQESE